MTTKKDLLVIVADLDAENVMEALLERHQAFQIKKVECEIRRHNGRDPGCRGKGVSFARSFCNQYHHMILMFDHEGSGAERIPPEELENQLETELASNGWEDNRATVIVIHPELEAWVWGDSKQVDQVCGWSSQIPSLRQWLLAEANTETERSKPKDPKTTFKKALKNAKPRKQFSAALFRELGEKVSFKNCQDRAFNKLKTTLKNWFPIQ